MSMCAMMPRFARGASTDALSPRLVQRRGCCKFQPRLFTAHDASRQRRDVPCQPGPTDRGAAAGGQAPAEDEPRGQRHRVSSVPAGSSHYSYQRLVCISQCGLSVICIHLFTTKVDIYP